jgi:archaellum component FlaC
MSEEVNRLEKVEQRLTSVESGLEGVHGEVRGLRGDVGGLTSEVHALRVLGEQNTTDIKRVAEVQTRHGKKLDEITKALEPLNEIRDFVRLVASDHEHRIQELEKRTGIPE